MITKKNLHLIIPAAGKSERFGENKLLYKYNGGQNFLDKINQAYCEIGFICNRILVTGFEKYRKDLENWAAENKFITVNNFLFEKGMFSSIKTGLKYTEKDADGFIIHPADCPFVNQAILKKLFNEFCGLSEDKSIIIPTFNRRRGHPPFFRMEHREKILSEEDHFILREYYNQNNNVITYSNFTDDKILIDIDTKKEFRYAFSNY